MKAYLLVNAILYFIFGIWCLVKMTSSSNFLGYSFVNNSGKAEYLALYTGMQIGFAAFLAVCAMNANMQLAGLIFGVCIYLGIIITRTISIRYYGNMEKATYMVGALEYGLAIWGAILLTQQFKK